MGEVGGLAGDGEAARRTQLNAWCDCSHLTTTTLPRRMYWMDRGIFFLDTGEDWECNGDTGGNRKGRWAWVCIVIKRLIYRDTCLGVVFDMPFVGCE
jgi:hypothetical protein